MNNIFRIKTNQFFAPALKGGIDSVRELKLFRYPFRGRGLNLQNQSFTPGVLHSKNK